MLLWLFVPICCTALVFYTWALSSPSDILTRRPFLFMGVFCLLYAQMTTKLMVCHVADQDFSPVGPTYCVAMAALVAVVAGLRAQALDRSHEEPTLYAVGALCLGCYLHLLLSVSHEFTSILDIKVFRVKPKPQ